MKKVLASALAGLTLITGSVLAGDGQSIFQSKGCAACHQAQVDTVGPSLKNIAKAYNGKKEDLIKFLKGEVKPKVWPDKFPMMQPQLNTTKALSKKDLEALADYILSNK
ncbi:MAG: cytochrome C552 [Persephonella sp.]|nr:MAG: cytochrome C552 [Persephonella sp.]